MKTLAILALAFASLPSFAAPLTARCTVTGASLYDAGKLENLLIDDGGTRVIPVGMGETEGSGTYNTFAHLNLGLADNLLTLNVSVFPEMPVGVQRDPARPLWARVSIPSRLGHANRELEVRCERVSLPYVLEPVYPYDVDAVNGLPYVATTVPAYAAGAPYPYPAQSLGEALAASYCVAGNAAAAAADMMASLALWRTDVQNPGMVLTPKSVDVAADGSLRWSQRTQELVCVKSHLEKQYNSDTGMEEEVTVCDRNEKHELAPVLVELKACE